MDYPVFDLDPDAPDFADQYQAYQGFLLSLYSRQEDLHPDLVPCLDKTGGHPMYWMIRHPLYVESYSRNAVHNYHYLSAKERLAKAEADGDWLAWIGVHAQPFWWGALAEIADKLTDSEYWEAVGEVFCSVDNGHQYRAVMRRLLSSKRPGREAMMALEEREELGRLPSVITVHRGYGVASCKLGWSWTLDRDKAVWFAERFAALDGVRPKVISGTCDKADVVAYFSRRDESEVVVDPKKVRVGR